MSIFIKGFELPKNCGKCIFRYEYICMLNHEMVFKSTNNRHENCPLIEVPPHGDLIDRRKLPLAFIDITDLPTDRCLPVYLQEDVDDAPTIIESEGE